MVDILDLYKFTVLPYYFALSCRVRYSYAYDYSIILNSTVVYRTHTYTTTVLFCTLLYSAFSYRSHTTTVLFGTLLSVTVLIRQLYSSVLCFQLPFSYDNSTLRYSAFSYHSHTTTVLFCTLLSVTILIRQQYSAVLCCRVRYSYAYSNSTLPTSAVV
jgi:hypothetical protein